MAGFPNYTYPAYGGYNPVTPFAPAPQIYQPMQQPSPQPVQAALYPMTKRNCAQVTACGIRTRTKYSLCVVTTPTGGSFRMLGTPCCSPSNNLTSIDGGAAPAPTA